MKFKLIQQLTIAGVFLAILAYSANGQQSAAVSKAEVQAVLDSIDNGLLKKDEDTVVANFASNAVITATIVEGGSTDTTKQGTKEYRQALDAGFKSFDGYKIKRKDVTVAIGRGGKTAQSNSTLIETFRFDGKMKQALTKESATFERIGSKVLVVKEHSEVTMERT